VRGHLRGHRSRTHPATPLTPAPPLPAQMDTIIGAVPKATLVQTIEKYL
jgi:hypothetical protein